MAAARSSAMAALLSGGSVPTSVIHQTPLGASTASPVSSAGGSGSPSGGEDSYFGDLALYNGGYSGPSGLDSPHRRKKMKKQRNPDLVGVGPDGCPSGKRKNREGELHIDLISGEKM